MKNAVLNAMVVVAIVSCGKNKFNGESKAKETVPIVSNSTPADSKVEVVQKSSEQLKEEQERLRGRRPSKVSLNFVLDTGANFANSFATRKSAIEKLAKFIGVEYPQYTMSAVSFDDTVLASEKLKTLTTAEGLLKLITTDKAPWFKAPISVVQGGAGAGNQFGDNDKNFGFGALQESLNLLPDEPDTKHILLYQSNALARESDYSFESKLTAEKFQKTLTNLKSKNQDLILLWAASSAQLPATSSSYSTPRDQMLKLIGESKITHIELGFDFSKLPEAMENNGERMFNTFVQ